MCQIWVSSGEWEELILSAVRANGSALQYASQRLRNDQEVGVPRNCCRSAGMGQIYQPFSTHQLGGFTTRCYFKHMFLLNISKQNQLCGSFHPLATHGRAHIRFGRNWLSQDFDSLKVPDSGKVWKSPCTAGPQCLLLRWCGMGMRSCSKQSASNLIAIRCQWGCGSWNGFHGITIRVYLSSINV